MLEVILSIGYGRLHLVQAALHIAKRPFINSIRLVLGWVPRQTDSRFIRLCSWMLHRNLMSGMRKRMIVRESRIRICQCAVIEALTTIVFSLCSRSIQLHWLAASIMWRLFGWCSRRYFYGGNILHVRSGAGQGGAIAYAHRLNMKVITDHSIAHPAFMERQLKTEYERNGVFFDLGPNSPFWHIVIKDCQEADIVLVNSKFVWETFLAEGFPPEKLRIVYQGTRADFFGLRLNHPEFEGHRSVHLLFTGSFGFRKGGEYLLKALIMLQQKGVRFEMDIVGSYKSARTMIEHIGVDRRYIHFHDPVPQDELKTYLEFADIYVFPSLAEGCASSGMEAMAAGLCVVSTKESGLPIVDGETGYLVPSKNVEALAERIRWLVVHPDMLRTIGRKAAKLISSHYTWEQYAENVEQIYRELCSAK